MDDEDDRGSGRTPRRRHTCRLLTRLHQDRCRGCRA
jgi:hypothetical protein